MKLYFSPGTCSQSPHIVLRELGMDFELDRVKFKTKLTESGKNYLEINPHGYVPALELDDGEVLTEGVAIVQYLADQKPESGLIPAAGTVERARVVKWLSFVGTELHKSFGPLFSRTDGEETKTIYRAKVRQAMDRLEQQLSDGRRYLTGDVFTVADAYLFVVSSWTFPAKIGLDDWPKLKAYNGRIRERDSVIAAMKAEGLNG